MESSCPVCSLSSSPRITFTLSPLLGTTGARWSAAMFTVLPSECEYVGIVIEKNYTFPPHEEIQSTCLESHHAQLLSVHIILVKMVVAISKYIKYTRTCIIMAILDNHLNLWAVPVLITQHVLGVPGGSAGVIWGRCVARSWSHWRVSYTWGGNTT